MNNILQHKSAAEQEKLNQNNPSHQAIDTARLAANIDTNVVALGTNSEMANIVAGAEKPNENERSISEKKSDPVAQNSQSGAAQSQSAIKAQLGTQIVLPTQVVMVRTVKMALVSEVKNLEAQVKKLQKDVLKYAHDLSKAFQQLRTLKGILRDIMVFTADFLKMLYDKVIKKESLVTVEY